MAEIKNYITPEGAQRLRDEYQQLVAVERPKVVETVAWAASNGDRSENADYQYGKKRLREIDKRLHFLSKRLEKALVVDPKTLSSETVIFSATVTISNEDETLITYQIVGEDEANAAAGKISWRAPLATAMLGKRIGDEFLFRKPNGTEESYIIHRIEF